MFEIIPVLPVNESCHWCEPQDCYTAGVWWGDCLLTFYTKDAARLESGKLNDLACDILKHVTSCLDPESSDVIAPDKLWKSIGQCGELPCYWADFRPAVMMAYRTSICIPVERLDSAGAAVCEEARAAE
jgi:hypothetical protein